MVYGYGNEVYTASINVGDVLDLVRQAYENCAKAAESMGNEVIAHEIRKLVPKVKAERCKEDSSKLTFYTPSYEPPAKSDSTPTKND